MKRFPFILIVSALSTHHLSLSQELPELGINEGEVALLTFDSGGVNDSSCFVNNGTAISNAAVQLSTGFSYLWCSNSLGQQLQIPHSSSLNFGAATPFSLSAWINITGTGANQQCLFKRDSNTTQGWLMFFQNSTSKLRASTFDSINLGCGVEGSTVIVGGWHHVAAVFRRGAFCSTANFDLYVDGELQTLSTTTVAGLPNANLDSTQPIRTANAVNAALLNGYIDLVRIYPRELSASDVKNIVAKGH